MSQENVEVVRTPVAMRRQSSRTLDQRISLRFPRLAAINARRLAKLPPTSRVRRAALARAARLSLQAYNRRDLSAVVVGWDPEFEYYPARAVEIGLVEPCYRGLEGYRKYVATTSEVWGGENVLEPLEVIDLGERFVVLAKVLMRAQASGVPLTEEYAVVCTLRNGLVTSVREHYDHDEALEAAGLRG